MTIRIDRLWHGYASVRDYQAKKAYNMHEDLTIVCGNQWMTIPHHEIMSGAANPKVYTSLHDNTTYYLIDYPWKPGHIQEELHYETP